ncbi:glycosyltransferase family 4 protein [Streptomyces longisporoflavus]|uniref:glycosyltransferase family 4 protein n=1 Tax=Streptomyces longisporoflavus TaxID=28044 RepID=UPI00167EACAD|nr:glycosyltransferase family 4 protein [Streptomyces longisporoflavus]
MQLSSTDRPPSVLHVAQPVDGGVARVVTDLVKSQLAAGMRVDVACPDRGSLPDAVRGTGLGIRPWAATRSPGPGLPDEVRRLARIVAGLRPDIVHAHSAKAGLAARLALRGRVPTVFQPHAWSFEAVGGVTAGLALRWERFGARWATHVVCVSEAERRTGQRAGIDARWSVIPNGVDVGRFRPGDVRDAQDAQDTQAMRTARTALGLPAQAPLVVCVGRLCRQKGQDVLLRAWAEVAARMPLARLVLVGDGPDAAGLRERAPDSVLFAGDVRDATPWYRAADLVVLPSRWEGMALVPLEAMACARPVVVTDVDGARESLPPELVPHGLVPAEDPRALARAVTGLLGDPPLSRALGRAAHRHVLNTHDVRHTADAVAAVYRELLGVGPIKCRESSNP